MNWTLALPASTARRPQYVPASARSVGVAVNGGVTQYLNSPSTTLTIAATAGVDTFFFQTYDGQNGQGNVLSRASITQTVAVDTANVVSATLSGVIASLGLTLSNPSPNAGVAASVNVNIAARDADGNVIIGAADYSPPIALSITDPDKSGTLSLPTAVIPNPGTAATLAYNGGTLASGLPGAPLALVVASSNGVTTSTAFTPTPTVYQFSLSTLPNVPKPEFITAGPDGNMWFSDDGNGAIGQVTPAGVITEFPTPGSPFGIISASDGNLWFADQGTSAIGHMTTSGTVTEAATANGVTPSQLVDRGDGVIWYTSGPGAGAVGQQLIVNILDEEEAVPTAGGQPFGITTAADGNLYFSESSAGKIGQISNFGSTINELTLTSGALPTQIVRGPDGKLWFPEFGQGAGPGSVGKIGRLDPTTFSVIAEYPTVTPNSGPYGITVGKDGALWFTERNLGRIGRVTTAGAVSEFISPADPGSMRGIASAPDGSLWFCEQYNAGIARLVY